MHAWLVGAAALLSVMLGPVHAAEPDKGVDLPCRTRVGQHIVYKSTFTIADPGGLGGQPTGQTNAFSYEVRPDFVAGRVTHGNGMLPVTFVLSSDFAFVGLVPDDPRWITVGNFGFESIYGTQFKQALAFCGRRWIAGEVQTIELPFLKVEATVTAKLVKLGRLYGRSAAQFAIEVSGRMPMPGRRTGEMAGRGSAWVDLATGITLESVVDSDAVAYDTDQAPVLPYQVKEERRLDQQLSRF